MAALPDFTADCSACAALCCMALHFDAGEDFAIDKPAGLPCPNLDDTLTCTIFDELEPAGFGGCARYDCRGAGQRVTQEVFARQNWLTDPKLAIPMTQAFDVMRKVHEGLELLVAAMRLDLDEDLELELEDLIDVYAPEDGWNEASLDAFLTSNAPKRLAAFLPRLRAHV
ncbi:MAG: hypothetical protein ACRBCL_11655 [Maritimibacter sp.]